MTRVHSVMAVVAATLGLAAGASDVGPGVNPATLAAEIAADTDHISAPELADMIMRNDTSLHVIDLRPASEFEALHIPTAVNASITDLLDRRWPGASTIVLYSEGATHSAQAWVLLRMRGHRDVRFLREGMYEWLSRVMEPRLAVDATDAERRAFARAEPQSRFFGGQPRSNVPRAEVPSGYWTDAAGVEAGQQSRLSDTGLSPAARAIRDTALNIRRRGC
jgi:rhodanese-related sulfurtransferase